MSNQKPHETDSYRSVQRIPDPDRRAAKLERLRLRVLREMCEEFGDVSCASIVEWAGKVIGVERSVPLPGMREALVVEEIGEMAIERLEDRDEHDSDTD